MHSSTFRLYLSIALAALLTFSNAFYPLEKRQINLFSGLDPKSTDSNDPGVTPTSSSSSSDPLSTANSGVPSTSSSISSASSAASTSSSSSIPTSSSSSSQSSITSTPPSTSIPQSTVFVIVTTDGSTFTSASTAFSSSAFPTQSGSVSPDQSGSGGSSSGPNKPVIIGATVGVGGAIILAGLGFVAWRLWGKNKHHQDEDEILMAGSSAHGEKLTHTTSSPFKSTLDQYHAHSGTNF